MNQKCHEVGPILSGLKIVQVRRLKADLVVFRKLHIELTQQLRRRGGTVTKKQDE
jgi:hypothetical protein